MEQIIASAYKVKPEFETDQKRQIVWKHPSIQHLGKVDDIYRLRIGRHHAEILHMFGDVVDHTTDGFYTSYGRWVDRYDAAKIAIACGQCQEPLIMDDRLDSSDIFDN